MGQTRVEFSCELGGAWAYWEGDPPASGTSHDVEIDLSADEIVSLVAAPRPASGPSIRAKSDGTVVFHCLVVSSEDGYTDLQIGDSVSLVDIDSPATPGGTPIVLEMRSVRLFPFHL